VLPATGEAKYGKPILDLAVTSRDNGRCDKCVLVSYDSTMISNLSSDADRPAVYARDSLQVTMKRRFEEGDVYFDALTRQWLGHAESLPRVAATGVVKRGISSSVEQAAGAARPSSTIRRATERLLQRIDERLLQPVPRAAVRRVTG